MRGSEAAGYEKKWRLKSVGTRRGSTRKYRGVGALDGMHSGPERHVQGGFMT